MEINKLPNETVSSTLIKEDTNIDMDIVKNRK